jgi:hypothetical protein
MAKKLGACIAALFPEREAADLGKAGAVHDDGNTRMVSYSDTDRPKGSANSLWLHLTPPRQISTLPLSGH